MSLIFMYSFLANRIPEGIQDPGYHLAKIIKRPTGNKRPGIPFSQNQEKTPREYKTRSTIFYYMK